MRKKVRLLLSAFASKNRRANGIAALTARPVTLFETLRVNLPTLLFLANEQNTQSEQGEDRGRRFGNQAVEEDIVSQV
jgi:hypothetical protein